MEMNCMRGNRVREIKRKNINIHKNTEIYLGL